MLGRGKWIILGAVLTLLAACLIVGAYVHPPVQYKDTGVILWSGLTTIVSWLALLWPSDVPIMTAAVAAGVAWVIANQFTGRIKRIEATLEFSRQFHELIQLQRVLNRTYDEALAKAEKTLAERAEVEKDRNVIKRIAKEDAKAWWWQFFDLLLYEFDFWQQGYVREERFMEWMIWRWHDSHPRTDQGEPRWATCGMNYMEGWNAWQSHPAHGNRLLELLKAIHTKDHPKQVPEIVDQYRGITAPGDYRGPKGLSDDVKKDKIKVEDGAYIELATGKTFSAAGNQIKDKKMPTA